MFTLMILLGLHGAPVAIIQGKTAYPTEAACEADAPRVIALATKVLAADELVPLDHACKVEGDPA